MVPGSELNGLKPIPMFKKLIAVISFAAAFGVLFPATAAVQVDDLYQARVPVEHQGAGQRAQALQTAMREILTRIAGPFSLGDHPGIAQALKTPARYVVQYRYREERVMDEQSEQPREQLLLWVQFEQQAIERLLRARIADAFPADAVVGEELGGDDPGRGRVWQLDPIDGTLNFAVGLPGFCTSIALLEDGEPVAACVHVPVEGNTYTAVRGGGARRDGVRLAVSTRARLRDAVVSGQFKRAGRFVSEPALLQDLIRGVLKVRKVGAIALELAYVAAGSYDALVAGAGDGIAPHDVAAGRLLVTEAGGRISDHAGAPYRGGGADLVASNGLVHDELCALIGGRAGG